MLEIRPTTLKAANAYVAQHHRHNAPTWGCKFAVAVYGGERLCGVGIAGRPVARKLDDGLTLEITRVCTDGTRNANSILYGACVRAGKGMGYKKIITYTLNSESGASLRAAGFVPVEKSAGGGVHGMCLLGTERSCRRRFSARSRNIPSRKKRDGKEHFEG